MAHARAVAYRAARASPAGEPSRLAKALRIKLEDALVFANGQAAVPGAGPSVDGLRLRAVNSPGARCLPCARAEKSAMPPSIASKLSATCQ
jgi:hypothetical protein